MYIPDWPLADLGGTPAGYELKFYLLGSPIDHSPSPALHNAGFKACGLRHTYIKREYGSAEDEASIAASGLRRLLTGDRFGGASVTIPLKQSIIPLLDRLGESAVAVGAVNTVVRTHAGELVGENTDYLGILRPVKAALLRREQQKAPETGQRKKVGIALILGAGGTARAAAYAARQLDLGVLVWNRSPDKATAVARDFQGLPVATIDDAVRVAAGQATELVAVISTVPTAANVFLPGSLLALQPVRFVPLFL